MLLDRNKVTEYRLWYKNKSDKFGFNKKAGEWLSLVEMTEGDILNMYNENVRVFPDRKFWLEFR